MYHGCRVIVPRKGPEPRRWPATAWEEGRGKRPEREVRENLWHRDLISLFWSHTGNLAALNTTQLFQYSGASGKGHGGRGGGRGAEGGQEKKNGFDTQGRLAKGGNKFTALSVNMAARCVMDHGASDGPTRGGILAKRMGTRSTKEKGVIPAAKQMKPQRSGGSSVDSLILAEKGKKNAAQHSCF